VKRQTRSNQAFEIPFCLYMATDHLMGSETAEVSISNNPHSEKG
jgi:hypothetical protein